MTKENISKVPQVTMFFWIIKVLCTTVGETASDYLNINLGFGLINTCIVAGIIFFLVLFFQIKSIKYTPLLYWATVILISIFGTLITDIMTDNIGIALELSTVFFTILMLCSFIFWYKSEKSLSIHSIYTKKREVFYWTTILFTFALGTASGDLLSEGLGYGYVNTGIIVLSVIFITWIASKYFKLNSVLSFWIIYIMTRPLGASTGDFLSQSKADGGIGLGTTFTSLIFIVAIICTVIYISITKIDTIKTKNKEEEISIIQSVIVIIVIILISLVGYSFRQNQLVNDARNSIELGDSSIGDLSLYRDLENGIINDLKKGNNDDALKKVDQIESSWDKSSAIMKKLDKNKWQNIDSSFDKVFKSVRSSDDTEKKIKVINESINLLAQN